MLGTATKLQTARTINLSGDVSGSANFDGSGNITIPTSIKDPTTQTASFTTTKNATPINFKFKRSMNIVWVEVKITFPTGQQSDAGNVALDDLIPEWAKCTQGNSEMLGTEYDDEFSCSLSYTSFSSASKHRFNFSYVRESYSTENQVTVIFTYIV